MTNDNNNDITPPPPIPFPSLKDPPRPNFELYGKLFPLDDGHIPETFRDCNDKGMAVRYPQHQTPSNHNTVHVYDDALPLNLVHQTYQTAIQSDLPLGTYVTITQAKKHIQECKLYYANDKQEFDSECSHYCCCIPDCGSATPTLDQLATSIVAHFLFQKVIQNNIQNQSTYTLPHSHDYNNHDTFDSVVTSTPPTIYQMLQNKNQTIHGVGVWILSSQPKTQVQYHMDYAEFIRYKYNVLVPPLIAGTIQCTPSKIEGGEFAVNIRGWEHYDTYGYKGKKVSNRSTNQCSHKDITEMSSIPDMGDWRYPSPDQSSNTTYKTSPVFDEDSGWITIPYQFNRGIIHTGQLPHLSNIIHNVGSDDNGNQSRRVIVGLNVFCDDIGHIVQAVPEHSKIFRDQVLNMRASSNADKNTCCQNEGGRIGRNGKKFDVNQIRANKTFTKVLVLGKRNKVKADFEKWKNQMIQNIFSYLLENLQNSNGMIHEDITNISHTHSSAQVFITTVVEILDHCWDNHCSNRDRSLGSNYDAYHPSRQDLHILIHQIVMKKKITFTNIHHNQDTTTQSLDVEYTKAIVDSIENCESYRTNNSIRVDENGLVCLDVTLVIKKVK